MENLSQKMAVSTPSWGVKMAYGEAITLGGRELVPAALVIFGFGAGEGSGEKVEGGTVPAGRGAGSGGGGGGYVLPAGAYVSGPDGVRFRPNPIAIVIVAIPLISAAGWALARIVGAARGSRAT